LGKFNVYNALPAIIIGRLFGVNNDLIAKGLMNLKVIPGRMEKIDAGQDFTVLVDYAHEKESMTNALETVNGMKKPEAKVIVLLGAEGGGRDKAKRPIMGEIAAKMADFVIVSNVDPYLDDPQQILEDIAVASEKNGKIRNQNLFVIEDRRLGIKKALSLAKTNDIVLITGKGAEQSIVIGGKRFAWDDREVVKEELKQILSGH
jgi:UDP-N-acetylmuramyl tripeptide synthase